MSQMNQKKTFPEQWKVYKETIENALDRSLLQISCRQEKVIEAMRYSLLGGGKRIRAILVLEFAKLGGIPRKAGYASGLRSGNDPGLFSHSR